MEMNDGGAVFETWWAGPRALSQTKAGALEAWTAAVGSVGASAEAAAAVPAPWHLFLIQVDDEDGQWTYVVSAESDSQDKARELAEGAVLEDAGTEAAPGQIGGVTYLGRTDSDIFEKVGPL